MTGSPSGPSDLRFSPEPMRRPCGSMFWFPVFLDGIGESGRPVLGAVGVPGRWGRRGPTADRRPGRGTEASAMRAQGLVGPAR